MTSGNAVSAGKLGQRSEELELLDGDNVGFAEFHDCLRELESINRLTLAYRPTLSWLRPWLSSSKPLTILDVGSGGGDMLRRIEALANKLGKRDLSLIGVDLNPWSKQSAESLDDNYRSRSSQIGDSRIRYVTADVFYFEPETPVDLVICSLFTHHLTDAQVVDYLRWLQRRARKAWFINDLHRHPLPYHFIKSATAMFSRNILIRNDAALSVARSFTAADWQRLLQEAGIGDAQIQWYFPFRLCISQRCGPH